MTDIEKLDAKLNEMEKLFYNSPTYGISVFQTLILPKVDGNANLALLENFKRTLTNQFNDQNVIEYYIEILQYIRNEVLTSETAYDILEKKIHTLQEKVAMDLILYEDNLSLKGDFDPFQSDQ